MAKYFKNITSFENLKKQFRDLLKRNHPDNGGDVEIMKEINVEFDALFPIWKNKMEKETGETINETAESTRRHFYTQNGWEGSRYNSEITLKEIAQIVRTYVKEKYPTCKFSVRTSYASMCRSLHVSIKEFPGKMYKTGEDLKSEGLTEHIKSTITWGEDAGKPFEYDTYKQEIQDMLRKLNANYMFNKDSWTDDELIEAYEEARKKNNFYAIRTEYFESIVTDVEAFVNSYNYSDCDGMTDYFDVNFWFFGCSTDECKEVVKTARIKNNESKPAKANKESETKTETEQPEQIEEKTEYTYKITKGEDTRDGSDLWLVRIEQSLSREEYKAENEKMKVYGGYYSKFRHAFIFREDPTSKLIA